MERLDIIICLLSNVLCLCQIIPKALVLRLNLKENLGHLWISTDLVVSLVLHAWKLRNQEFMTDLPSNSMSCHYSSMHVKLAIGGGLILLI